jgi:hypothetical protein
MKVRSHHERIVAATPERIAALVSDFDRIWPTDISPPPRARGEGLYESGPMLWQEHDRPAAVRAFRVISPKGFRVEHWFDLDSVSGGTLIRHTLEGHALGEIEALWADQIEPFHNRVLEAVLDNIEAAVTCGAEGSPCLRSPSSGVESPVDRGDQRCADGRARAAVGSARRAGRADRT